MNTSLAIRLLVLIVLLPSCAKQAAERPVRNYERSDRNASLSSRHIPNELRFDRVVKGQLIGQHTLLVMPSLDLVMPSPDEKAFLAIEFERSNLQQSFIRALYFSGDTNTTRIHPFTSRGIESVLTDKKFILNIHSGVILHLRNDMEFFPDYKTFVNDRVMGKVTKVRGEIFFSSDTKIKIKLRDIFVEYQSFSLNLPGTKVETLPDGSTRITGPPLEEIPYLKRYPPRVVKGP